MRLDRLTVDAMARTTQGDDGHEGEGVFIGAALTQIELEAGVSRRQLSKDLGASYSHLTNLTHNIRRAGLPTIAKLSKALPDVTFKKVE